MRTLTAEGRMSARILTALPFVMALWQWRVNPDNFESSSWRRARWRCSAPGSLMVLGGAWVRRVVKSMCCDTEENGTMNLTLVLGSIAVVGAIAVFWWALTSRPSAARANLFAGIAQAEASTK